MRRGIKAGRLANGFELGKGKVVHYLKSDYEALCGDRPSITFIERENEVSCKKCLKLFNKLTD